MEDRGTLNPSWEKAFPWVQHDSSELDEFL